MPNRIVRLFLQEAGRQYDSNRGYPRFGSMTPALIERFVGRCAYCGEPPPPKLVEEHLVPINRASVGLHAWGNIVPACKTCNDIKRDRAWSDHPRLDDARRRRIADYVADYQYNPDVTELRAVLERLYTLSDSQTERWLTSASSRRAPTSLACTPPRTRSNSDSAGCRRMMENASV